MLAKGIGHKAIKQGEGVKSCPKSCYEIYDLTNETIFFLLDTIEISITDYFLKDLDEART